MRSGWVRRKRERLGWVSEAPVSGGGRGGWEEQRRSGCSSLWSLEKRWQHRAASPGSLPSAASGPGQGWAPGALSESRGSPLKSAACGDCHVQERCFLRASWPATDSVDRACAVMVFQDDSQPCSATLFPSDSSLPPSVRFIEWASLSLFCQSYEDDPPILVTSPTGCLEAETPKSLPSGFMGEIFHQVTQAGEAFCLAISWFFPALKGNEGNGCLHGRQLRKAMCRSRPWASLWPSRWAHIALAITETIQLERRDYNIRGKDKRQG